MKRLCSEVNKPSPSEIPIKPVPVPAVNNTINYLRVVYWTGFTLQLFLFLVSTLHVILILRRSEKTVGPWGRFFLAPGKITPFSWGRIVVVSARDYPVKGQQVLLHEFSHQRLLHFIDLAIAELFIAVNWYNPVAWLLRYEMKRNHEFEVDREVVAQGSDMAEYQLSTFKGSGRRNEIQTGKPFCIKQS